MAYDLLIRGGRVVDGSGLPSYVADVGVKGGKIVEVGRLTGTAARTIGPHLLAFQSSILNAAARADLVHHRAHHRTAAYRRHRAIQPD